MITQPLWQPPCSLCREQHLTQPCSLVSTQATYKSYRGWHGSSDEETTSSSSEEEATASRSSTAKSTEKQHPQEVSQEVWEGADEQEAQGDAAAAAIQARYRGNRQRIEPGTWKKKAADEIVMTEDTKHAFGMPKSRHGTSSTSSTPKSSHRQMTQVVDTASSPIQRVAVAHSTSSSPLSVGADKQVPLPRMCVEALVDLEQLVEGQENEDLEPVDNELWALLLATTDGMVEYTAQVEASDGAQSAMTPTHWWAIHRGLERLAEVRTSTILIHTRACADRRFNMGFIFWEFYL